MTDTANAGNRARTFAAMEQRGLDVLVLGRQDNAAWATGMHRLWTAGTRPFGAGCVLVTATGEVHLLSSWDDGVPDDIPFDHLYGITWNPAVMAEALASIPGISEADVIGVDSLSPGFRRAAKGLAPAARLEPADDLMAGLRRSKSDDEIESIRRACVVARAGVDAAVAAVTEGPSISPGTKDALEDNPTKAVDQSDRNQSGSRSPDVEDRRLTAEVIRAVAEAGGGVPSSGVMVERGVSATICVDVGVLVDDWEGGLGRTIAPDGRARGGRTEERVRALIAACTAGASGPEIRAAGGDEDWLVRGVGMGFERPVINPAIGAEVELIAGDVLSVGVSGDERHHREIVAVTDRAADVLT